MDAFEFVERYHSNLSKEEQGRMIVAIMERQAYSKRFNEAASDSWWAENGLEWPGADTDQWRYLAAKAGIPNDVVEAAIGAINTEAGQPWDPARLFKQIKVNWPSDNDIQTSRETPIVQIPLITVAGLAIIVGDESTTVEQIVADYFAQLIQESMGKPVELPIRKDRAKKKTPEHLLRLIIPGNGKPDRLNMSLVRVV
ncbi:MAG: hypothetical protein KDB27_36515 [Planctomycetales bacterium]|nr:hypothetical protein [Planctomycetales bacterium]